MRRPTHERAPWFQSSGFLTDISKFSELEARLARLSRQDKGAALEVFAEGCFVTRQQYRAALVWAGAAIPPSVLEEAGLSLTDKGVDGVFRTHAGELHAYQVKYRSGRIPLSWGKVATFLGQSDLVAKRVLVTNSEELTPVLGPRRNFYAVRGSDLDRLRPEDFEAIRQWLAGAVVTYKRRSPDDGDHPHQVAALDAIVPAMTDLPRATVVMACATGKTLVGFWTAQRLKAKRTLVLLPSLALMRQTLHEWLLEGPIAYLAVCSDPTVDSGHDALLDDAFDSDFPVDTDPVVVRDFFAKTVDEPSVIFSTYQSARVVSAGMPAGMAFDLVIFDEAHKTAGRRGAKFTHALSDDNLRATRRLFFTATPKRTRWRPGEPIEVYSMNQPEVYGPRVYELSFPEAIRLGIIAPYKIVITVVRDDAIQTTWRGARSS